MAIDRYSKDYRLIDSVDERGRIRTETKYIGEGYVFQKGLDCARGAGKRLAVLCVISWLAFLAALYFPSIASRSFYAVLPCAFLALPLWFLSAVAVTSFRVKEPFIHRDADRFTLRLPAAAVFAAVLSAAAVLGAALALGLRAQAPLGGDWVFLGGNLICFVCALLCHRLRDAFAVRKQ